MITKSDPRDPPEATAPPIEFHRRRLLENLRHHRPRPLEGILLLTALRQSLRKRGGDLYRHHLHPVEGLGSHLQE